MDARFFAAFHNSSNAAESKTRMTGLISTFLNVTDEQLMWRVKLEDDHQAFATLLERWQGPIRNLGIRMVGDVHKAEDLCQTAFAKIFAGRARWEPTAKVSTFLWRIALNLCHDEIRKQRRRGEFSLEALDEPTSEPGPTLADEDPGPDSQLEANEKAELVRKALQQLEPIYRETVVLRHYEGLKFCEIALVLKLPEGTVKSRMAEGLSQLRKLLNKLKGENLCQTKTQNRMLIAL
jgi:RNA polymerase sigma-70 factor (ECF subfamily)